MLKLTPHLDADEVACKCGCGFGLAPGDLYVETAVLFERLRSAIGEALGHDVPLTINSGCRCCAHNAASGGEADSAHMRGLALDIAKPDRISYDQFAAFAEHIAGLGGCGRYPNAGFIHIDTGGYPDNARTRHYPEGRRWTR
jgi:uncharacterized protein YcbK (DUF882 family)